MNYIQQVNFYWNKHEEHSLSAVDIATYFYILKYANAKSWRNPVEIRNSILQ